MFLTACFTGLRTGEVCGLTWDDIDLEKRLININHNVYHKNNEINGRWYFGTPKTVNSIRNVHINSTLYNILVKYKNLQNYNKKKYDMNYITYHLENIVNDYGKVIEKKIVKNANNRLPFKELNLVFTKENGLYSGTDIIRYPFKVIHHELRIKNCRFYDLRGSYATRILRNGAEIRDVADILGHSRVETTENYYISSSEETRKEANDMLEKIIDSEVINEIINLKF